MKIGLAALAAMMLACLGLPAMADDAQLGALTIKGTWSRATPPGAAAGVAFFTIVNSGAEDDILVSAAADVSSTVELHTHVMDGDVMRMRQVPSIAVPAGQTVALAPGGLHIMLIGLKSQIQAGTSFPLTLTFQRAGKVTVAVPVQGMGAMPPGMDHDHMAPMDHMKGMMH